MARDEPRQTKALFHIHPDIIESSGLHDHVISYEITSLDPNQCPHTESLQFCSLCFRHNLLMRLIYKLWLDANPYLGR